MKTLNRSLIVLVLTGAVPGCIDEPVEGVDAVEQPAQAACAMWSCQINQCQQDPAIYGACCILAASAEYPVQPKPSCEAPPPKWPIYSSWCVHDSPLLSCMNHPIESNPYYPCLDLPLTGDAGEYYGECQS
jgi:hypothetical protein